MMEMSGMSGVMNMLQGGRDKKIKEMKEVVQETSLDVMSEQIALVRHDTGELEDAIDVKTVIETDTGKVNVVGVLEPVSSVGPSGLGHDYYNEYGTAKMSAKPYIRPSAEINREPFFGKMKRIAE